MFLYAAGGGLCSYTQPAVFLYAGCHRHKLCSVYAGCVLIRSPVFLYAGCVLIRSFVCIRRLKRQKPYTRVVFLLSRRYAVSARRLPRAVFGRFLRLLRFRASPVPAVPVPAVPVPTIRGSYGSGSCGSGTFPVPTVRFHGSGSVPDHPAMTLAPP